MQVLCGIAAEEVVLLIVVVRILELRLPRPLGIVSTSSAHQNYLAVSALEALFCQFLILEHLCVLEVVLGVGFLLLLGYVVQI